MLAAGAGPAAKRSPAKTAHANTCFIAHLRFAEEICFLDYWTGGWEEKFPIKKKRNSLPLRWGRARVGVFYENFSQFQGN
jgi:hypothetical protein